MFSGRTSTSTTILIMMLMMVVVIKNCDGGVAACNDSTAAECRMLVDEEKEFLMDTEEHRRILAGYPPGRLAYKGLEAGNPACGSNCGGRYDPAGHNCKNYDRSCR
ncbi:hypothetical protein R6Q59_020189 [Mikania micrantha]